MGHKLKKLPGKWRFLGYFVISAKYTAVTIEKKWCLTVCFLLQEKKIDFEKAKSKNFTCIRKLTKYQGYVFAKSPLTGCPVINWMAVAGQTQTWAAVQSQAGLSPSTWGQGHLTSQLYRPVPLPRTMMMMQLRTSMTICRKSWTSSLRKTSLLC